MISLLDFLAEKCGVHYLSDLRSTDMWKTALKNIAPSDFPLKDWNEAADYLYDVKEKFKTAEDAKSYFLK